MILIVLALLAGFPAVAAEVPAAGAVAYPPPPAAVSATVSDDDEIFYVPPGITKDRFGIRMFHPTAAGGREWTSRWDNRRPRELKGRDPDDPELKTSPAGGRYRVDGRGVCRVRGPDPGLHVTDTTRLTTTVTGRLWQNVEITVYGMRVETTGTSTGAGIQVRARTDLTRDGDPCAGRAYGGRFFCDGRADFEKLVAPGVPGGGVYADTIQAWQRKMRAHKWVGLKFVVRNMPAGVRLEIWRDRRNGYNGGNWQKLGEWTDRGSWGEVLPPCASGVDPAEILTGAAPSIGLRSGEVGELRFKWFSVREIAPGD